MVTTNCMRLVPADRHKLHTTAITCDDNCGNAPGTRSITTHMTQTWLAVPSAGVPNDDTEAPNRLLVARDLVMPLADVSQNESRPTVLLRARTGGEIETTKSV